MLAWAPIVRAIEQRGLAAHGAFALDDDERQGELADVATIALVGLAGRRGWAAFSASPEAQDGAADPLDRWSRRVVDALAAGLGARALYPFDGPPHWPFQRWARRAEPMHVSPLGLLIHRSDGLWRGYRGALAFAERLAVPPPRACGEPVRDLRRAALPLRLSGRRLHRRRLRRRRLRGASPPSRRPRLHGGRLPRPARLSGRRRTGP